LGRVWIRKKKIYGCGTLLLQLSAGGGRAAGMRREGILKGQYEKEKF
jgi:hypothetical protein